MRAFRQNEKNIVKDTQILVAHRLKYVCSLSTVKITKAVPEETDPEIRDIIDKVDGLDFQKKASYTGIDKTEV